MRNNYTLAGLMLKWGFGTEKDGMKKLTLFRQNADFFEGKSEFLHFWVKNRRNSAKIGGVGSPAKFM
jgi:hypothetical protein